MILFLIVLVRSQGTSTRLYARLGVGGGILVAIALSVSVNLPHPKQKKVDGLGPDLTPSLYTHSILEESQFLALDGSIPLPALPLFSGMPLHLANMLALIIFSKLNMLAIVVFSKHPLWSDYCPFYQP